MRVEAVHHVEQVLGRRILVGENEHPQPAAVNGAVIEAAAHIGAAALLPAFQDERAHPAGRGALLFQPRVDE
jgi:hypothetical protein